MKERNLDLIRSDEISVNTSQSSKVWGNTYASAFSSRINVVINSNHYEVQKNYGHF